MRHLGTYPKLEATAMFQEPDTLTALSLSADGALLGSSRRVELLSRLPLAYNFLQNQTHENRYYQKSDSTSKYRNFLAWLFETFNTTEDCFRAELLSHLRLERSHRVLVVSCGLGTDLSYISRIIGPVGELHAQDLSEEMIRYCIRTFQPLDCPLYLSVSDALSLPYVDCYFDRVYHFGGINLFPSISKAVSEFSRVLKPGGLCLFGDEGVAEHLRSTDYGKMLINNNSLWSARPPLGQLPSTAANVTLQYVLDMSFWIISFVKCSSTPYINSFVEHLGPRGGTMHSRYYGALESVNADLKCRFQKFLATQKLSESRQLEKILSEYLDNHEIT